MKEYIVQAIEQETIDSFDGHNAPELIRCKDCVNRHDPINCQMYSEGMDTPDDWFCADGGRKKNDAAIR